MHLSFNLSHSESDMTRASGKNYGASGGCCAYHQTKFKKKQ